MVGSGLNMDANVTISDSYGSLHNNYSLQVDRLFMETLQAIAHISYTHNEYGTRQQRQHLGLRSGGIPLPRELEPLTGAGRRAGRLLQLQKGHNAGRLQVLALAGVDLIEVGDFN